MLDLTWSAGASIVLLILVLVAVIAQIIDADRGVARRRREILRAKQLERARSVMASRRDADADERHRQRLRESALLIERNCWHGPDVERRQ
jgi:hypothetical protein